MSSREWTAVLFVVGFLVWAWFAISLSPCFRTFTAARGARDGGCVAVATSFKLLHHFARQSPPNELHQVYAINPPVA